MRLGFNDPLCSQQRTKPGTPPEIAAQHIGGFFVASAITLTFDPNLPCPMKAQANITVV